MSVIRLRLCPLERRDVPSTFAEIEPNNVVFFPNDVTMPAGDVLVAPAADWLTILGAVGTATDRDCYRFTLTNPSGVFLNLDSRETGLSTTLDAVLDVYNSSGSLLLGSNDEGYDLEAFVPPVQGVATATTPDSSLYLDLAAGTYIIRVTSFQSATAGNYHLRVLADGGYGVAAPVFASRPAAPVTLYLDFNGHAATDDWGVYSAPAFDLGGPVGFSPGEKLAIRNIWKTVAEDFAPFDINVTTTDPASIANGVGYQIVFTSNAATMFGQSSWLRGTAFVGSFNGPNVNTGFVFQPGFGDYQGGIAGRIVAAAIEYGNEASQEFGRALGLLHYGGVNLQPSGIMQNPDTGLNRSTWSSGMSHSGEAPVLVQDDAAAIASIATGIALVADDYGNTLGTATAMPSTSVTGIIASAADRDYLSFSAPQGSFILTVSSDRYAGNFDAEIRVFNAAGQQLALDSPSDSFDCTATLYSPGTAQYFVEVRGASVAGAIGTYSLNLAFATVTGPGQVISTIVNSGAVQRSMVTDLVLRFSRPMSFPSGTNAAIFVTGSSGNVPIDIDLSGSNPSQTIATIRFPNGSGGIGSFADGNYQLTIIPANCLDDANQQLDGDNNGIAGGFFNYSFYRLFGDANGDRSVSSSDFNLFRTSFGGSLAMFDFNGDGSVSANDFNQFRARFGASI